MKIGLKAATASTALAGIDARIDEIERILDVLHDETSKLESRWDGEAREAMSVAVKDWNASIERLSRIGREANGIAKLSVERVDAFDRRRAGAWHR
ncbi:WXG100 family type VII secretion target [Microbacterium sp. 18062]|uniref:WXG100 family type VII secretion target n=1 Tax=Microbacterium sp. 18062 TaxID=2681410 RepID=UPI00135706D6|nr:hypothetical protein [Microbacterium sp. 18062]